MFLILVTSIQNRERIATYIPHIFDSQNILHIPRDVIKFWIAWKKDL